MLYGIYVSHSNTPSAAGADASALQPVRAHSRRHSRSRLALLASLLLGTVLPNSVLAAEATPASDQVSDPALLKILVRKHVLTQAEADQVLKEAKTESAQNVPAAPQPRPAGASASAAAATPASVTTIPPDDGALHVTYVPEVVRKQLLDKAEADLEAKARKEGWLAPNVMPSWLEGLHLYGDVRVRYEGNFFPKGNDNTGAFPNFNSINTGSPYDVSSTNPNFAPQRNVDQDRNYFRLRARFGLDADLGDGFSTGLRIATGQDDQPVSENQTMGYANGGQGGDFSKYAIWIDRAYIKYAPWTGPNSLEVDVGRFDNPFFSTNLTWWSDIGFDGAAVKGSYEVFKGVTPFITGGAFPIFNTDLNFASNQPAKFESEDKWLYAAQVGSDFELNHSWKFKIAGAYYDFENVQGRLSAPCTVLSASDICNTDDLRPSYAQNGNTYMALRNIVATSANNFGTTSQYQYFGLASGFRELAVTGRMDFDRYAPFDIWATAEFVDNLAFDKNAIAASAVNNRGAITGTETTGPYAGGNKGYFANLNLGEPELKQRWNWNFGVGYRYVESDAVMDGFNDPDFGLGGTNLRGFTVVGNLALSKRVSTTVTWMSADSIAGPPYAVDVVMFDLNAKF